MRAGFLGQLTVWAVTVGALACGGDYTEETPAPGSTSGTAGADAGVDAAPSEVGGGLGATPGKIACGRTSCDLATQICCASSATDQKCQDKGSSCDGAGRCDDASDCKEGQKCCGEATGFNSSSTKCVDRCDGLTSAQVCRTDEECGAQDCVHQSCYGIASYLCGLNPFCQKL